ncbi:cation:dicarboxylase symporter family transporter [Stieleria sp. TO1_6]|uniref:cation:dicarboxylate symporter family transporter n=1 Tax=Stieleria tagensis TaxID=2956795 RepID=UPI00209B5C4B|nr:cation:dicarboxylase symporter family transporter [Stieleria tagensis]MCO8120604.1 cation:dicarboxylase symporter family transporter [Stieleria tagensis]
MTQMIVVGIIAGVLCGLFFGESTESIQWVGDVYVGLLQMAVLPYVAVSLVANTGRLSPRSSYQLLRSAVIVMISLWLIAIITLVIMTMAFPVWNTGSFFSSRFSETPPQPNWMELFVPSNPFRSLAENAIPAVVVFSLGVGFALMRHPRKEQLLEPLQVFVEVLGKLNRMVAKLTPIGMFAIVASTAGTISPEKFKLLQGYLLTYGVSALLLTFIVLPVFVTTVTSLRYRDVIRVARNPLITAFVIGNTFVVLPMIIDAVKELFDDHPTLGHSHHNSPGSLVALAYPFPDVGRIIGLIFLPFAAWFFGNVIDPTTYPALLGVGFLGSFGKPVITLPLLLEIAELPSDIFNLYLASGVIAARFGDLMKSMHLIVFSILTIAILEGTFTIKWGRLISRICGALLLVGLSAGLIRGYLTNEFQDHYSKEKLITQREMQFHKFSSVADVTVKVLERSQPNPDPIEPNQSRVQRIQQRGFIRVGFDAGKMPFAYFRADTQMLIGFDIQMAYYLADDLGVGIEFVPIEQGKLYQQLSADHFDVAMSAIEGSVRRAASMPSVDAYMDVTLAFVVPDHKKSEFQDKAEILKRPQLKLAVIKGGYFAEHLFRAMPKNTQVVSLESPEEYFNGVHRDVDGLVISAESGSAWTLRNPQFAVANPFQNRVRVPLYYMTGDDIAFGMFLKNWLALKRSNGTYDELYDHWILGEDPVDETNRWCILRDVLGWID